VEQVSVASQKLGTLAITSPQFTSVATVEGRGWDQFHSGKRRCNAAGSTLTLQISGLPVHSTTPRNIALGLAILIGLLGLRLALQGGSGLREIAVEADGAP